MLPAPLATALQLPDEAGVVVAVLVVVVVVVVDDDDEASRVVREMSST